MKKLILLSLVISLMVVPAAQAAPPAQKSDLRVLYVGGTTELDPYAMREAPDETVEQASAAARMAAFEAFLNDYFTSVTVINAHDYKQEMSDDYDVTVMDGIPQPIVPGYQDQEKGINLTAGYLTEDFDRPVLMIADISDHLGRRIGTKNDWYCLCLYSDAHSWRAEHPIFNGPFPVTMTVADKPTPEPIYSFPHYFEGGVVPATLPMWRVQAEDYDEGVQKRIGMVARPGGYEDSPDAEWISSGVCAKSPDAVAIGRHGNFFHWGFAASPANMTEEAKPVLANAIVYISKFAGQTPIARKYNDRAPTRSYAKDMQHFMSYAAYERSLEAEAGWNKMMEEAKVVALAKQAAGEELDEMEQMSLNFTPEEPASYEDHVRRMAGNLFDRFGTDMDAYARYYDDNYDYFYNDGSYDLLVDEDARSLGIPNNDPRILDEAIKMLETGRDVDKGHRILARYTLNDFPTAGQWREWYDKYRDLLFFTESGGWVFLVNSREPGVNDYKTFMERRSVRDIAPGQTSDREPVAVAADVTVLQDGGFMLAIKAAVHPGYHIYDNVARGDAFLPTQVEVELPAGYTARGGLGRPQGSFYTSNGTTVYKDTAVFTQEFTGTGTGTGAGELRCRITYQCCDRSICFPPATREFTINLK